jgi:hypothetical protein
MVTVLDPNEQAEADCIYIEESPFHPECPKVFTNPKEKLGVKC